MRRNCSEFWEGIVAIAEGGTDDRAAQHVRTCAPCSAKLNELRSVFAVARAQFYDAPEDVVDRAKALMPARERRMMGLLRSTLAWTGARVVAEDFQIVVGSADIQARLMYTRSGAEWLVMGKLPSSDWSAVRAGDVLQSDEEGRFSFAVSDLADSAFELIGPAGELSVPSAEELLASGPPDRP